MTYGQALLILNNSFGQAGLRSGDVTIRVRMKGESPEAHAEAILIYFGYTKSDEDTFKAKYGYDLRQNFVNTYRSGDRRAAHKAVGNGYFEVAIPLPNSLVTQIESVKNPISSSLLSQNGNSNFNSSELNRPTKVPANATPSEREFYRTIDLLKTEAMNFGLRFVQDSQVRTDYLKTIKYASNEFVELAKSGQIPYEEAARRASLLRNYILEVSRGKNSELGRSIAEFLKKEGPTFEALLEKYAKQKFQTGFSALSQANKEAVLF